MVVNEQVNSSTCEASVSIITVDSGNDHGVNQLNLCIVA